MPSSPETVCTGAPKGGGSSGGCLRRQVREEETEQERELHVGPSSTLFSPSSPSQLPPCPQPVNTPPLRQQGKTTSKTTSGATRSDIKAAAMPKVFLAKYKKEVAASRDNGEDCSTRLEDTGRK